MRLGKETRTENELIIWIHVSPILTAICTNTRVDADTCTGQERCTTWTCEKRAKVVNGSSFWCSSGGDWMVGKSRYRNSNHDGWVGNGDGDCDGDGVR